MLKPFVLVAVCQMSSSALTHHPEHNVRDIPLTEVQLQDPGLQACLESWAGESMNSYTYVSEVKELACAGMGIKSLEGIGIFHELLAIDLARNPIEDYSPLYVLEKYKNIGFIWLWDNEISCREESNLRKRLPRTWIGGVSCTC